MRPGIRIAVATLAPLLAAGCSTVPERELQGAADAITLAQQMGVSPSSNDLRGARDKLRWSKRWVEARDNEPARWLAEQAKVDAELAQARAATREVMREATRIEAELRGVTRTSAKR
jgi:hypothetical protein